MELLLKHILVTAIAVSVAVPAVFYTFQYYEGAQYVKNPENYIPGNVSFAGRVTDNQSLYYLFIDSGNPGLLASISVFTLPELLNGEGPWNITQNITFSYYQEYRGISIFMISGINASALIRAFVMNSTGLDLFVNNSDFSSNLQNITLFVASPQNTLSIIGGLDTVRTSINSCLDRSNLLEREHVSFSRTSTVSLYLFPPAGSKLEHVSSNITSNSTEIYMHFHTLNSTTLLSLTTLVLKSGLELRLEKNVVEIIASEGIMDLYTFFEGNGGLLSIIGSAAV